MSQGATPRHVAIIMDGNGRWAKARGLPRVAGHRRGAEAVRNAVEAAGALDVRYLTLFGFSSENWRRPESEIADLMGLLRHYLRSEIAELHAKGVRVRVIGDRVRLPADVRALVDSAEETTRANTSLDLVIALSYGARDEIVHAARTLAAEAASGALDPAAIDEAAFARRLFTADIPDPDLLVRTSGEKRISNFLLWQCAYAEFVFLDVLWPDFGRREFEDAIAEFGTRERRYGAVAG
jgi:undecaprenyl diphosphate synthase